MVIVLSKQHFKIRKVSDVNVFKLLPYKALEQKVSERKGNNDDFTQNNKSENPLKICNDLHHRCAHTSHFTIHCVICIQGVGGGGV